MKSDGSGQKIAHPLSSYSGLQGWAWHVEVLAKKSVQSVGKEDARVFRS